MAVYKVFPIFLDHRFWHLMFFGSTQDILSTIRNNGMTPVVRSIPDLTSTSLTKLLRESKITLDHWTCKPHAALPFLLLT